MTAPDPVPEQDRGPIKPAKAKTPQRSHIVVPLTVGEALRLPATVDVTTAARALGFGRTKAYALVRDDAFPCRLLRIGDTWRVPTSDILALLGLDVGTFLACQVDDSKRRPAGDGHA